MKVFVIQQLLYVSYRTRDEVKEIRSNLDPISSFRDKLIEAGMVDKQEIKVRFGNSCARELFSCLFALV